LKGYVNNYADGVLPTYIHICIWNTAKIDIIQFLLIFTCVVKSVEKLTTFSLCIAAMYLTKKLMYSKVATVVLIHHNQTVCFS